MRQKLKSCAGCKTDKIIYKRIEGKPYCKYCSYRFTAPKEISKRSTKKIAQDVEYTKLRRNHLEENPHCEVASMSCTSQATEIHHKEYRGLKTNDVSTWLKVCRSCHLHIHANPEWARANKFLI